MKIILTGLKETNKKLSQLINKNCIIVDKTFIELKKLKKKTQKNIYDWGIFSSPHSINLFFKNYKVDFSQLLVIGEGSYKEAQKFTQKKIFLPLVFNADGIKKFLLQNKILFREKNILLTQSLLSNNKVYNDLKENFNIEVFQFYKPIFIQEKIEEDFDAIVFFSPSALDSYLTNNQQSLINKKVFSFKGDSSKKITQLLQIKPLIPEENSIQSLGKLINENLK